MREGARPSGRWCRTGQQQVGDDRTGAALQRNEEHERVTVLLDGGPQDAGDDRLGGGAARRAVAATHLAGDDGGPDSLFGLPVGGLDVGAAHASEERGPLGAQVLQEAAVRRIGHAPRKQAIGGGRAVRADRPKLSLPGPAGQDVGGGSRACAPAKTSMSRTVPFDWITPAELTEYGRPVPAVPGSGRDSNVAKLFAPCPMRYFFNWFVSTPTAPPNPVLASANGESESFPEASTNSPGTTWCAGWGVPPSSDAMARVTASPACGPRDSESSEWWKPNRSVAPRFVAS